MVKRMLWIVAGVVLVLTAAVLLSGCISTSSESPGVAASSLAKDGVPAERAKATWIVKEADLPAGYPPPGPVDQIIVKQYPSYRSATVTAKPGTAGQGPMFNKLFDHIKQNDIAMTAPVQMEYASPEPADAGQGAGDAGGAKQGGAKPAMRSMAFLYADDTIGEASRAGDVTVADHPPMTVLSIGFRGGYADERFAQLAGRLRQWAADHPDAVRVTGPARTLGYNSPFVPVFMRYGEVQLPVELLGE